MLPLVFAGASFLLMVMLNLFGVHKILPYFIVGLFLWFFMLESGVHATIAGVIAAMAIPSKPKRAPADFAKNTKNLLDEYDNYPVGEDHRINEQQKAILLKIKESIYAIGTPASRLEQDLHLPVALIVIPLFALANAGITIDFSSIGDTISKPVSIGIMMGLVLGKVIGIFGVAWLAIKLKIASLPKGSNHRQLFGVAFLGGIGFTMSIFVADLAFAGLPELIFQAKVGILAASLVAGIFGYIWLFFASKTDLSGQEA